MTPALLRPPAKKAPILFARQKQLLRLLDVLGG